MEKQFSIKELEDVVLKAAYPIVIGQREIEVGEVVARFDKIQIANFDEVKTQTAARGGFDNRGHVWWDTTKELRLRFVQGIFSKEQYSFLNNSRLLYNETPNDLWIQKGLTTESNEKGYIVLDPAPEKDLFIYDYYTGEKLKNYSNEGNGNIYIGKPYRDVKVDYMYQYRNPEKVVRIGTELIQGYLTLTGKTKYQEDITGDIKTGIIEIPKLKLLSNLSISLGSNARPIVGEFYGIAVPVGTRGNSHVMDLRLLNENIDADF